MWENELLFLSIAIVVIFVAQSLILIYLIVRKSIEIRFKKKVDRQKQLFSDRLLSFLFDGEFSRELIPDSKVKKHALEELLSRFAEVLEGEIEKKNLYFLAETYLSDYYRTLLGKRKWSIRMNALYHIEEFQIHTLAKDIKKLIIRPKVTRDEKVHGLRILSLFHDNNLYEELVLKHNSLSEYEYRSILFVANEMTMDIFVLGFYKCQPPLKNAIIDLIGMKNELKYASFIESVYKASSDEVKIRALKALASIGFVKDIKIYLPLCKSEKWQERMMIAKLLGAIYDEEGIKCLVNLLHDPSWYVRSQAGQAINHYPNGKKIFKEVIQTTKDQFAKEMAWEWMNKGE
jgi:hypothetical protein